MMIIFPLVTDPLSPLVSKIFDLTVADIHTYIHTYTHTYKQNSMQTDNKGHYSFRVGSCLKLAVI